MPPAVFHNWARYEPSSLTLWWQHCTSSYGLVVVGYYHIIWCILMLWNAALRLYAKAPPRWFVSRAKNTAQAFACLCCKCNSGQNVSCKGRGTEEYPCKFSFPFQDSATDWRNMEDHRIYPRHACMKCKAHYSNNSAPWKVTIDMADIMK